MAGAAQEDKRIRRTKKLLRQALTRLMQQKDFPSITVTDVVREADINRGTFYAHYRDVYDLIADIQPRETSTLEPVLTRAMDYLEENREIVTALVRGTGVEGFGRKMITVLEECRLEMLPYRTVEDTYAARFMSTGIVGMLEKWITDPQPIPKTEMTELILRALTQSLM